MSTVPKNITSPTSKTGLEALQNEALQHLRRNIENAGLAEAVVYALLPCQPSAVALLSLAEPSCIGHTVS